MSRVLLVQLTEKEKKIKSKLKCVHPDGFVLSPKFPFPLSHWSLHGPFDLLVWPLKLGSQNRLF